MSNQINDYLNSLRTYANEAAAEKAMEALHLSKLGEINSLLLAGHQTSESIGKLAGKVREYYKTMPERAQRLVREQIQNRSPYALDDGPRLEEIEPEEVTPRPTQLTNITENEEALRRFQPPRQTEDDNPFQEVRASRPNIDDEFSDATQGQNTYGNLADNTTEVAAEAGTEAGEAGAEAGEGIGGLLGGELAADTITAEVPGLDVVLPVVTGLTALGEELKNLFDHQSSHPLSVPSAQFGV